MEELQECEMDDIDQKPPSLLKPSYRDEDDHHTVSTLNDSTLDPSGVNGNSTNDLPLVQRIGSTLSESMEESFIESSVGEQQTSPSQLQPEPWHSLATQTILQKLSTEYQRQRVRLGELRSKSDFGLGGSTWKRNLQARDFKLRILSRRIAELEARNQDLMKRQVNQGVLQQKLEAAQRQIKILQTAWNQTLDLHLAELDISDESVFLPRQSNTRPSRQAHVEDSYPPRSNITVASQAIEISQIRQPDAAAATSPASRPDNNNSLNSQQHSEEDTTIPLYAEITSLQAVSKAQKGEMAKICYDFLQDRARRDKQYATLETKQTQARAHIEQLESDNAQLLKEKQLLNASLRQHQSSISSLCKKQSNLFFELEEKTRRLDKAEQEIARLNAIVEQQRQEALGLQEQTYTQQQELMDVDQLKSSNESLLTQCQSLENSLSQSSQHVSHLESVISQLKARLQATEQSNSQLKAQNERLSKECQETKRKEKQQTRQKPHEAECISEVHASLFGFW